MAGVAASPDPNDDESPADGQRPRRNKDLFDISLWWLPLILVGVVAALVLLEYSGVFGF
jgi:hypothetical protein